MLVPLTVEDVMTTPVETTAPDATAGEAARLLEEADVGSLVVCDGDDAVGIITESDVVGLVARDVDAELVRVADAMSTDLVTVRPDDAIEEAARLLVENDIRRLPVCEDGRLVGIVTTTDLSAYLPHLSRPHGGWAERLAAYGSTSPSTSYDDPEWTFEHEGDEPLSVGDVVRFRKELTGEDVERFAEASGDTNRLHLEDDFAARTRFGGRIVHGVLAAGGVSAALARIPGLTIYLSQDLRFLGPVAVGEAVTAVCEVVEDLGKGKYELATTVYDEDGEVVVDGSAVVLVTDPPEGVDPPG